MRNLFLLLLLTGIIACNNNSPATTKAAGNDTTVTAIKKADDTVYIHHFIDSLLEKRIIDTLMKLPFIKKSNQYIDSFSNHRHGIAFMMDSVSKDEGGITVEAGYNGDYRFEPYYWFHVKPGTLEIEIYNITNNKSIPLKLYLKKNH